MQASLLPQPSGQAALPATGQPVALSFGPAERKALSVKALAGVDTVSGLGRQNDVSRKFVRQQRERADAALNAAFAQPADEPDVLFHLPVTRSWLDQLMVSLVLSGHASLQGVVHILGDLFDYGVSRTTVHDVIAGLIPIAREINRSQDLSNIRVGAHDEIFQAGKPVLTGADVVSTYCYLLAKEDHRDETTWGVHLLDLSEQRLDLDYTIADSGGGIRAGQSAAWPETPCHGDVFHAEREIGKLRFFLRNRASAATTTREKLERQMARASKKRQGRTLSGRLATARQTERDAAALAEDVALLADWLRDDILSLAGRDLSERQELFDFVVDALRERESLCLHRIKPVRSMLENQRDALLAFAAVLDQKLADIARRFAVPQRFVHDVCDLEGVDPSDGRYWQRRADLHTRSGRRFHEIQLAVHEAMADTTRASSIVENINGRLRNYFFLRRHIGDDYLELLRFFLNHRRFARSRKPERVGKSPTELLTGQPHPHWLELLGFELFRRN